MRPFAPVSTASRISVGKNAALAGGAAPSGAVFLRHRIRTVRRALVFLGNALFVFYCTAVGVYTEQDWVIDAPGAGLAARGRGMERPQVRAAA